MTNPTVVVEKNDSFIEGESESYVIDWSAEGTPSAADTFVYIKGQSTDLSATILSGAEAISGSLVTCPLATAQSGHGGFIYHFVCQATFGTRIRRVSFDVPVVKVQGEG